jgi:DNA-binding transcriptional ArsR family regulator
MDSPARLRKNFEQALEPLIHQNQDIVGHFGSVQVEGKWARWTSVHYGESALKLRTLPEYKVAQILSVLGSEVRLSILRHLLDSPKTVAELVTELGMSTTGQAYHHLRELERAGYIEQKSEGRYHFRLKVGRVYLTALELAYNAGADEIDE